MRIDNTGGDPNDTSSLHSRLSQERHKILGKELTILNEMRLHSAFTAFEPVFGGKFPKENYDTLIQEVQKYVYQRSLFLAPKVT